MDRINEQMYQANVELVDRNKLLEKDVEILQNTIDEAIRYVEKMSYQSVVDNPKRDLIKILKKEIKNEI